MIAASAMDLDRLLSGDLSSPSPVPTKKRPISASSSSGGKTKNPKKSKVSSIKKKKNVKVINPWDVSPAVKVRVTYHALSCTIIHIPRGCDIIFFCVCIYMDIYHV